MNSETETFGVTVGLEEGLHSRPATQLVGLVENTFPDYVDVRLNGNDKKACARSILELLMLGAHSGADLIFEVSGASGGQLLKFRTDVRNLLEPVGNGNLLQNEQSNAKEG